MKPVLIGIVGGSGSGKTWLAEKLEQALAPNAGRVSLDDFYLDRSYLSPSRRARMNFDRPQAIDWKQFEAVLTKLKAGRPARVPRYDFVTHCQRRQKPLLHPKRFLLLDGLWLLRRPSVRRLLDLSIFLQCRAKTRLQRRLARDRTTRGRTLDSIRRQFRETVQPMHVRYVAGQARWADVVLTENCEIKTELPALVERIQTQAGLRAGNNGAKRPV